MADVVNMLIICIQYKLIINHDTNIPTTEHITNPVNMLL